MSKKSLMPSITPKVARILGIHTASNPLLADLKMSASLSVLQRLGIKKSILHGMAVMELKLLYDILRRDMCVVGKEIVQRQERGKKML
jgi:hypothetical protein